MLFLHFLRVLFSVRFKRRIIWLMPAAAHTINILLVQIPAIEREERERERGFTASDLCFNIGEYLGWAHFYEILPAPQFGPHTTTILWSGGRGHWPPHSATTLRLLPQFTPASSHTNTIIYFFNTTKYFSALPNIFSRYLFAWRNVVTRCWASMWLGRLLQEWLDSVKQCCDGDMSNWAIL